MTSPIKCCAIIPHYNHATTLESVVKAVLQHNIPCYIVDDGSEKSQKKAIEYLATWENVEIIFNQENRGKGAAMKTGFDFVSSDFTHALQIDADAQHDFSIIKEFLSAAQTHPNQIICGNPIYSDDAPKSRLIGRKITNFWIAVNTLSTTIKDGMCGFRLYPLKPVLHIMHHTHISNRMEFDIEILVRLKWDKVNFIWIDTPVHYSENGISHFHMWQDNLLISKIHAKLFFTMLGRYLGIK